MGGTSLVASPVVFNFGAMQSLLRSSNNPTQSNYSLGRIKNGAKSDHEQTFSRFLTPASLRGKHSKMYSKLREKLQIWERLTFWKCYDHELQSKDAKEKMLPIKFRGYRFAEKRAV